MRLLAVVATISCLLSAGSAAGGQAFPYKAHVVADGVYVRSGPGKNYYPTAKLQSGDTVEVFRHDPGGWYAIKPPEGSFEWVSGRYLKLGEDNIAEVAAEGVASRVGSNFSDIRDVIQVRLHQGELVEVLGSAGATGDSASGTWYKIAPPSGTFRWVQGKFVDLEPARQGIRRVSAASTPLTDPHVGERALEASQARDRTRVETADLESPAARTDAQVRRLEARPRHPSMMPRALLRGPPAKLAGRR